MDIAPGFDLVFAVVIPDPYAGQGEIHRYNAHTGVWHGLLNTFPFEPLPRPIPRGPRVFLPRGRAGTWRRR